MTSESDSKPRRRPPTIDLTATEIRTESAGSQSDGMGQTDASDGQAQPRPRGDGNSSGTLWRHALGAAVGALLVAGLAVGLWASGIIPARNAPAEDSHSPTRAISSELAKIEAELHAHPAETALATRVGNVEEQTKALSDSLAAINRRLDDIAVAAQNARQHADAADQAAQNARQHADAADQAAQSAVQKANAASDAVQGVAQSAQNSVQRKDLDALAARIAALEKSIQALSDATAHQAASADDHAARAALAAEALRATVERGAPYQAELATVKSFGADQNDVSALEPFAASGIPTAAALARTLLQLIPSLIETTAPKTSEGTFLGRLEDHARTLVRVTPVGAPAGDDASAVIARLNVDAAHADITAALADIDRLPPAAKALTDSWVQNAKARAAALAASRRIAAAALAGLSSTNTQ